MGRVPKGIADLTPDVRLGREGGFAKPSLLGVFFVIMAACSGSVMPEDDDIPYIHGTGEGIMEVPGTVAAGARRNEDIALDLMKFIAVTTSYGKAATSTGGVGFEKASGGAAKPEEYAATLLQLYGKCLDAVGGKK